MNLLFFDTEFTGLHKNTTLISIGIIDEEGKSFYAEFNDYDKSQVDNWIEKNVISNLVFQDVSEFYYEGDDIGGVRVRGDKGYVREKLMEWLSHYEEIQFVSDVCHFDFTLFISIFGSAFDLPKSIVPCCHDINQDIAKHLGISDKEAFDYSREELLPKVFKLGESKHNSLYDAFVIKYIYELCNNKE